MDAPALIIPIRLDGAPAKASLNDLHATTKQQVTAIAKDQAKADQDYIKAVKLKLKAMNDLANEIDRRAKQREKDQDRADAAYVDAVKKKLKAEKQLEDQKNKAIKDAQSDQDRADAAYVKAVKDKIRAEKQLEDQKKRAAEEAQRDQDAADEAYVRAVKANLRAEKQLEDQKKKAARQQQRDQEKADADYIRAVQRKLAAEKQLEEEQEQRFKAQVDSVAKLVTGIAAVTAGAAAFASHFDKIKQDAFSAAEDVMRMRGAVRELQALRDQLGNTGGGVSHIMAGAAETLQKPEEFQQMELAGLGVGELAIKGKGDREQFEKAMVTAGKMQAQEGGDAGAYGQLMGQIALQSKGPLNAEAMEGKLNRLYEIQRPGGFRTMSQAMGQYSKLNGLVQNEVYTPEEAMGLASAFSVSSPEEAATKTEQYTRSVMAGRIKARGMKVSDDVDLQTTDEYFKQLGIGEQDSAIERGKKIAADMAAQKGAVQAQGKKFNPDEYLMLHGFGNQEDRQAIMDFSGLHNSGKLEKIEAAQNAPLDNGAVSRRFEGWKANDSFARSRAIEIQGQLARNKVGEENIPLVQAQEAAFNRLYAQGKISGTFKEWQGAGLLERGAQDMFHGGYHNQVNEEAQHALQSEREKLGMSQYGGWQGGWTGVTDTMRKSAQEVQKAGGDVTGGLGEELQAAARDLREAAKTQNEAAQAQKDAQMQRGVPPARPPNPLNRMGG